MNPEQEALPKKITAGSITALFDKTPAPKKPTDVYCPHFWELKYANGCNYDCQWCYLTGTFRQHERGKKPYLKDINKIKRELQEALIRVEPQTLFNAGEVSDALVYEGALLNTIIPLFKDIGETKNITEHPTKLDAGHTKREVAGTNPHKHKLLLLTKNDSVRTISLADAPKQIIFAHSINAAFIANNYELEAPHPIERLAASRKAVERGYETRLRLDPMVPIEKWQIAYRDIIRKIMKINPWAEVITLGSLRGLRSTLTFCEKAGNDMGWRDYLDDETNWGRRVSEDIRVEMYALAIKEFRRLNYTGHIALCKESLRVWQRLKEMKMTINGKEVPVMDYGPGDVKCNCVL
jgi:spore photoproduct lyase